MGVFKRVEGLAWESPFLVVELGGVDHEPLVVPEKSSPPCDKGEEAEDPVLNPAHNEIVP